MSILDKALGPSQVRPANSTTLPQRGTIRVEDGGAGVASDDPVAQETVLDLTKVSGGGGGGSGFATHNVVSDADFSLTSAEWAKQVIRITDTGPVLTTLRTVTVPSNGGDTRVIHNDTAQRLAFKTSGGARTFIDAGTNALIADRNAPLFNVGKRAGPGRLSPLEPPYNAIGMRYLDAVAAGLWASSDETGYVAAENDVIQQWFADAQARGLTAFVPDGAVLSIKWPLWLKTAGTHVEGVSKEGSSTFLKYFSGPAIVQAPDWPGGAGTGFATYDAAFRRAKHLANGSGHAVFVGDNAAFEQRHVASLAECGLMVNGLQKFCVQFTIKLPGSAYTGSYAPVGPFSVDTLREGFQTFSFEMNGTGGGAAHDNTLNAFITLDVFPYRFLLSTTTGLTPGHTYHVALDYNGSRVALFVGDISGSTGTCVAVTSATGNTAGRNINACGIGPKPVELFGDGSSVIVGHEVSAISMFRDSQYSNTVAGTSYTIPTTELSESTPPSDACFFVCNFTSMQGLCFSAGLRRFDGTMSNDSNGVSWQGYSPTQWLQCWIPFYTPFSVGIYGNAGKCVVENLTFENKNGAGSGGSAVWGAWGFESQWRRCFTIFSDTGFTFQHNFFSSVFEHLVVNPSFGSGINRQRHGVFATQCHQSAFYDCKLWGMACPLQLSGDPILLDSMYLLNSTDRFFELTGGNFVLNNVTCSLEGEADVAGVPGVCGVFSDNDAVVCNRCSFNVFNDSGNPVFAQWQNTSMVFNGCSFTSSGGTTPRSIFGDGSAVGAVTILPDSKVVAVYGGDKSAWLSWVHSGFTGDLTVTGGDDPAGTVRLVDSNGSSRLYERITRTRTTNATPTDLIPPWTLRDNCITRFEVTITAKKSGAADTHAIHLVRTYDRTSGTSVLLAGGPSDPTADTNGTGSAWLETFALSSSVVTLQGTGASSTTIDWTVMLSVKEQF